jgi:hypothetical protein
MRSSPYNSTFNKSKTSLGKTQIRMLNTVRFEPTNG